MEEIDLAQEFTVNASDVLYPTYKKKFAAFLRQEIDESCAIAKEWLTDENVAKFLVSLGKTHNYTPHTKKSAIAAINDANRMVGVPNIYDFKHLWPQTHVIMQKWDKKLKKILIFLNKLRISPMKQWCLCVDCKLRTMKNSATLLP